MSHEYFGGFICESHRIWTNRLMPLFYRGGRIKGIHRFFTLTPCIFDFLLFYFCSVIHISCLVSFCQREFCGILCRTKSHGSLYVSIRSPQSSFSFALQAAKSRAHRNSCRESLVKITHRKLAEHVGCLLFLVSFE